MPPDLEAVQEWVAIAAQDRTFAELGAADPRVAEGVCFHCQQCVEKLLKAFLEFKELRVPRTHVLTELFDLACSVDESFESLRSVQWLSQYAVAGRYPGFEVATPPELVREALAAVAQAHDFILARLPEEIHPLVMPATFTTFKRLKDKGLAALQQRDFVAAKPYLIQAAECMVEIAEANKDPAQRTEQEAYARELIELAKDCDRRAAQPGGARVRGDRARDGEDPQTNAHDWIVREKPNIRFDDIAGLDDVKVEIRLKMIYPFQHPELAARYGIDVGGGVLLYGPPGTGKTMFAKAIATELDATIFVVSPAQMMSKWVGEAEQNVQKLFEAAKAETKSVIFIDEIEALVPRRRDQQSTVMQRVVPQILQEFEGFDRKAGRALMFLGATNEPWTLDPAVMRPGRLDAKVYIPLPDAEARFKLFEIYLAARPLSDDVNFAQLVEMTSGYSGADIKALAGRSASRPFLESINGATPRNISMADLAAVIADTPPSVNRKDIEKFEQWAAEN